MIILACDSCGAQSPDATGARVADDWIALTWQTQRARDDGRAPKRYIFCATCAPRFLNVPAAGGE